MNIFTLLFQGMHESRRRHAERELRRYAHLIVSAQQRELRLGAEAAKSEDDASWLGARAAVAGVRA